MRTEYWDREEKLRLLGPGIWMDEPDEVEWDSEEWRVPCLIMRAPELGVLCGYVGVAPAHPWHGLDLVALNEVVTNGHWGVSWAAPRDQLRVTRTDETVADHWYVGFDCAHAFDLVPNLRTLFPKRAREPIYIASGPPVPPYTDTYKDFVWVRGRVGKSWRNRRERPATAEAW
jgi:hypothetical protein